MSSLIQGQVRRGRRGRRSRNAVLGLLDWGMGEAATSGSVEVKTVSYARRLEASNRSYR